MAGSHLFDVVKELWKWGIMADEKTFRTWQGMFTGYIEKRKREEAFNILENLRFFGQMEINKLTDEQVDLWFNMLEVFNRAFPDNPAIWEE